MTPERAPAAQIAVDLVARYGEDAHAVVDELLNALGTMNAAALAFDPTFWLRPKQVAPSGSWVGWTFITGRGFGKTLAISWHINDEIEQRGPLRILLVAQDEQSAIDIQVLGPSGLIATAPAWNAPEWNESARTLRWPNGAEAHVRTPEAPGKIRGLDYDLGWLTELQSWPTATRDEAFSNSRLSVRLGYARLICDATPKRRHPILLDLLADGEADPEQHVVVRGTTHENPNLGPGYIETLEKKYGGTAKGREELYGEMLDETEGATTKQKAIDEARRPLPDRLRRRIVIVDPAVTSRKGSDQTGIVDMGLGVDGQIYVAGDASGKYPGASWSKKAIDLYVAGRCDLLVAETNKGGDLITQNIRSAAAERKLDVVVIGKHERAPGRHVPGVVYVREVHARGAKEDRAQPAAVEYDAGRVSHVEGVDLDALEGTLTTWVPSPGADSPGDLDCIAHGVVELRGLALAKPDAARASRGLAGAVERLKGGYRAPTV